LTGLIQLIPGLYATSVDVGGSSFGTGSGPAARTCGRAGGGVVSYDGMIWDQTYGDFGTYEEAQITTAAKGADAMNPGVTMNLVVKSGSNVFKGVGSANYQSGDFQGKNVTPELLARGYAPGVNKFTSYKDFYVKSAARSSGIALVLRQPPRRVVRQPDSGFISLADRQQVEFYAKLQDPTGKITYQVTKNNKFEGMFQVDASAYAAPPAVRAAGIDAEPGLVVAGRAVVQVASILSSRATFDASLQRGGYWARRAVDHGRAHERPGDDRRARRVRKQIRSPRRGGMAPPSRIREASGAGTTS
jgi:hypothetical protein